MLVIGWEVHDVDSRPFFPKGVATAKQRDNTIDEVDETGKLVSRFSTYGTIGLDEIVTDPSFDPEDFEVAHMNSVHVHDDGTMLASMRATSSVIDVDRKTGKILWRLGGKKSDFTFVDDPAGGFSRQHDARWMPGGKEILLLDNGNAHVPRVTRAVRYAIDVTAKTAKLVWSYSHEPPLFSSFAGNVRMLPTGNAFVTYASLGTVTEIDPTTKAVAWELKAQTFILYRATYVATLLP